MSNFATQKREYQQIKNNKTMKKLNAYFFSYYFYFASDCKAGSCV